MPVSPHHCGHYPRALEDAVETTQLLFTYVVDALADAVGAVQREHGAGERFAVVVLGLQRGDVGQEYIAFDLDPQAVDARLIGPHQFRQVEIFDVARQR